MKQTLAKSQRSQAPKHPRKTVVQASSASVFEKNKLADKMKQKLEGFQSIRLQALSRAEEWSSAQGNHPQALQEEILAQASLYYGERYGRRLAQL